MGGDIVNTAKFNLKDSGERLQFDSGMVRDVTTNKLDYSLVFDGPMVERWAAHLTKGAVKYTKRNWMQASSYAERDRFRESAVRHFVQWLHGDTDEDHAAAIFFNVNGYEFVKERATTVHDTYRTGAHTIAEATELLKESYD